MYGYVLNDPVNFVDPDGLNLQNLHPNQRYNPTNTTPKTTPNPTPRHVLTQAPKITPPGHNPNGINNLPGNPKLPISERVPKNVRDTATLINGIRKILETLSGGINAPIIFMINPDFYERPGFIEPCGNEILEA